MNLQRIPLLFLLIIPLSGLFISCKKDPEPTPDIIGKWQPSAFQYRIVYEVSGSKYDKTGTRPTTSFSIFEIKADGTATGANGRVYTYTQSGDQITFRYGTDVENGKVILTGDQLTLAGIDNLIAGLSETDKLKEAKGWAAEVNGSGGGNGVYTDLNKATKAVEVYANSIYQRVK